jgi:hypothetical protein
MLADLKKKSKSISIEPNPRKIISLSNGNSIDLAQQKLILTSFHVVSQEDVQKLCSVLKENERVTHLDLSGIFLNFF